jgi:hypothetical protein
VKRKKLNEDIMANAERQVAGVGPGATDQPFYQMAIPTSDKNNLNVNSVRKPFELDHVNTKIYEIFEKILELKTDFENAENNISVSESQKVALEQAKNKLDQMNLKLIQIPDLFVVFSVDL